MSDILPNDYARMDIEVVNHNDNGDLIARTIETRRHIAQAYTGTAPWGDAANPHFLRLKARAYTALAEYIEENA
jgi:hypothetical protein